MLREAATLFWTGVRLKRENLPSLLHCCCVWLTLAANLVANFVLKKTFFQVKCKNATKLGLFQLIFGPFVQGGYELADPLTL